jgi:ribulokinase
VSNSRDCVLALDGGTESLRAALVDARGRFLATASRPYPTAFPRSGWAEQNPDDWWRALTGAVTDCLGQPAAAGARVAGIGLDATTCTLLALNEEHRPLRPALMWMDVRAHEEADQVTATGHRAVGFSAGRCSAEWMLPKVLWIKRNEPEVFAAATRFAEYTDWMALRLTGRLVLNQNTTVQRWFYNPTGWRWPEDLFDRVGLPRIVDRFPQEILPAGTLVGPLADGAASALELPSGVPVFAGGGDAFVALPGLGICSPGTIGLIIGSSTVLSCLASTHLVPEGLFGPFPEAILPGLSLVEAGQASSGSILSWFKRTLASDLDDEAAYRLLDAEAAALAPGSGGILALEYFQGCRTPHVDGTARGALWGLSLGTTRAQIFRAFIEAVALGIRGLLHRLRASGYRVDRLVACGGAARSELFMQIVADACGIAVDLASNPAASLLGGAVLAASGAGLYETVEEAAAAMTGTAGTFRPDLSAAKSYEELAELHEETYSALAPLMRRLHGGHAGGDSC